MAVMFEDALKKNIATDKLLPVYILFGEDAYLKTHYLNKISHRIADEDDVFNFCKFTGACDLQAVYDAAMQLPFMSDRKCIILNDYDYEHCSKTDFDRLVEILSDIPSGVTFIMYFDSVETDHKKGNKFKKLIAAAEKSGGAAVLLNHRSRAELAKMLSSAAVKRNCKMDTSVALYMVETVGDDINLLVNETEKLCAFVGEGVITKDDIDEACTKSVEANIYRLSDFILSCNSTEALKTLDDLFFMRIEPMAVLYTVSGVFVDMYRLYTARQSGLKAEDVKKVFASYKGKEFLLEKAARNLQKFDFDKLNLAFNALLKADKDLKSFGCDQRTVLEQMIVKLIYIISKGESLD